MRRLKIVSCHVYVMSIAVPGTPRILRHGQTAQRPGSYADKDLVGAPELHKADGPVLDGVPPGHGDAVVAVPPPPDVFVGGVRVYGFGKHGGWAAEDSAAR